jgi:hypothetical protein
MTRRDTTIDDGEPAADRDRARWSLTPRCIVTVRFDGIHIQTPVQAPRVPLGLGELSLLAAISEQRPADLRALVREVARDAGVAADTLAQFGTRLQRSNRLAKGAPYRPVGVPDHPNFALRPHFDLPLDERIALRVPLVVRVNDGRFEVIDHHGQRVAALRPVEVHALGTLVEASTPAGALRSLHALQPPECRITDEEFGVLLGRLDAAGLLRRHVAEVIDENASLAEREAFIRQVFDRHAEAQDAMELERERRTGVKRAKVVPVAFDMGTPAGVGMVVACAKAHEGGRLQERLNFRTDWVWADSRLEGFAAEPALYLFSNYLWSHARCIEVSRQVKERSPASITIHGGPDTPKYERDVAAYFDAHPHVDVIVRGEGELSATEALAALAPVIGSAEPDLSVLAGVRGISYRAGSEVITNPDRERVADLDSLPSPFLMGLFDVYAGIPDLFVTIETNRGCPYGCTFCDWGSATASRIRQFSIDRVYAELEWCADAQALSVSVADANFGIFARDVDISRKVAELRVTKGYPHGFGTAFAKNTVKHLKEIITILADVGILSQGVLSLQSMDTDTLDAIRRSNIKTEKYDALANEMRRSHLPLMVELMMGLPGMTLESFVNDLQECIDRELPARINHTTLLINSPMNDPDYLAEHQIKTTTPIGPGLLPFVTSTSSFTRDDWRAMDKLRLSFILFENYGVLRHVARFVRQETGIREIDFYRRLGAEAEAEPHRWPSLFALVTLGPDMMTAPYSWALVITELRDFVVMELGVAPGSSLEAVLAAQHALLPAHGRRFPLTLDLDHDVAAWNGALMAAKEAGLLQTWPQEIPRLGELGPGKLVIDDPDRIADSSLGLHLESTMIGVNWEYDSALSRARLVSGELQQALTDQVIVHRTS